MITETEINNNTDLTQADFKERRSLFAFDNDDSPPQDVSWVVGNDDSEEIIHHAPEGEDASLQGAEEEVSETDEEEEENKPQKKKNRTSSQKRIAELTRKLRAAQDFASDLLTQKDTLERRLYQSEVDSINSYEKLLTTNKQKIKEAMTRAHEEGDSATYAEAADLLAQYNTELMLLKKQPRQGYYQNFDAQQALPREIFDDSDADFELEPENKEAGLEWLKKNSWADPNSRNFDQSLAEEADQYSLKLERTYKLQGRADEIGTPEFWDEISDYMVSSYNLGRTKERNNHARDITMRNPNNSQVAVPSRRSSADTNPRYKKEVVLTPEQREIARSMRGIVTDGRGRKILDNPGLEEYYKKFLMKGH